MVPRRGEQDLDAGHGIPSETHDLINLRLREFLSRSRGLIDRMGRGIGDSLDRGLKNLLYVVSRIQPLRIPRLQQATRHVVVRVQAFAPTHGMHR